MIVVVGRLVVAEGDREAHLDRSTEAVRAARAAPGCLHFAVSADPVEPTWVDVAEVWASRDELDAFRASGGADDDSDPFVLVREFHVDEYETRPDAT